MKPFREELRAVLMPARKWHYLFHVLVFLVSISYWLGSLVKMPEATWEELAMYRPRGDNQVYPVISALSRFNFGDPTDALHYGKGLAGSQVVPLFPYAVAHAIFGVPGYMVADGVLSWMYFVVLVLLLRRCNFGDFSSLLLASAVAMRSLQLLSAKLSDSFQALLSLYTSGTWEWGFPDLLNMHMFVQRIPRPMGTEVFLVLLLYVLIRQWHERNFPTLRGGFVVGALLVLLMQGDPFSVAALGLLFLWILGWTLKANAWRIPWSYLGGIVLGTLSFGWYFILQRIFEHPDSVVRFGMAEYPRDQILLLPGFGPILRVGIVCALGGLVLLATRPWRRVVPAEPEALSHGKKSAAKAAAASPEKPAFTPVQQQGIPIEKSVATFCVALIIAGWLAQPAQLLLLGKGSQIYHYLIFVLPTLYAYSVVLLLFTFIRLALPAELAETLRRFGRQPHWKGAVILVIFLVMEAVVGMENKISTVSLATSPRQEINVPWAQAGDLYRPCLRGVEKQFRENPDLKDVRSFATLCFEVNFMLAGFYDKHAFLPDNAYSTLSDEELENRLFETLKIIQLPPDGFSAFIQPNFILNYWLGCAKYWMASDYQFSTREDYTESHWAELQKQPKQSPWLLCLPKSEMKRLSARYADVVNKESNKEQYPDAIILGLEKDMGLRPDPDWYREAYTNQLFSVYVKTPPELRQAQINAVP